MRACVGGAQCALLVVQQRILHRLPLPVLLEQIIERLNGQGVDGGIPLTRVNTAIFWTARKVCWSADRRLN
jgi:hypothetical protein